MTAAILTKTNLGPACDALQRGEVVAIPTETVYGLAAVAWDSAAVTKIFAAKERPLFDPLIVHVPQTWRTIRELGSHRVVDESKVTAGMGRIAEALMEAFWPGPLTLILPRHESIPDLVTSGLDRVGVRMPAHPVAADLLTMLNAPLAAPSANRFGRISPTTSSHVMSELGDRIPYIVEGGACEVGVESTVALVEDQRIVLLRPGKISAGDLTRASGVAVEAGTAILEKSSPGMLASHYAPRCPLQLITISLTKLTRDTISPEAFNGPVSLIIEEGSTDAATQHLRSLGCSVHRTSVLSESGNSGEAARNLFSAMRALDDGITKIMIAVNTRTDDGLWLAIRDRLTRASVRS